MLIVLGFILVDVILLVIYMVLEGVITHFSAGTAANEERPSQVDGVSKSRQYTIVDIGGVSANATTYIVS